MPFMGAEKLILMQNENKSKNKIPIINASGNTPEVPTALRYAKKTNRLYVLESAWPIPVIAIKIVDIIKIILRPKLK